MIQLGDLVKDEVTGFEGVVLARLEALYEATQCRVHPRTLKEDGAGIKDFVWLEEDRLVVVTQQVVVGFHQVAGVGVGYGG